MKSAEGLQIGRKYLNRLHIGRKGEALGFLGPNGAGKTTTIRHLMGFLKPKSGKCTIHGLDCWNEREKVQARLMHDPDILILDELTSGFDPLMQSRFVSLIAEEKEHGKTVLMSSHVFEEVERTCDRIGIIRKGRMIAVDSAAALHERHTRSYTVTLENGAVAKAFAADFGGICNGENVTVTAKQSLEEIFMNYYGGEQND